MKLYYKSILTFIMLFAGYLNVNAQAFKFTSNDDVKYLQEVKEFFESVDKKAGREFHEQYALFWNSNKLSKEEKSEVVRISNLMLKRRLKAYPDFENYYLSLQNFFTKNQPAKSFQTWQLSIDFILNGKLFSRFVDFLETTNNLFTSNTLYKSGATQWQASTNEFLFEFDSLPKVRFGKIDLICYAKQDTSIVYNTEGVYYPTTDKWIGKGGKIKWLRANFPESQTWAEFTKKYKLDLKTSQYKLDSVTYYNKKYFDKPLLGCIEEKCFSAERGDLAFYPKFDSYTKRFQLNELAKDIDYEGGFSMHGAKFVGSGTELEKAKVKIKVKGKVFFTASSKSFIIRPDKITSDETAIVFFNGVDSISHPGLVFKLNLKERKITLIRDGQGRALSPYFDSFHKLDLYSEALYWNIDEPIMEMKTLLGGSQTSARFESSSFFREHRYEKMRGMDDIHPLQRIKNYSDKVKSKQFDADKLSAFMGLSPDAVKPMLLTISNIGIIDFDVEKNIVTIKDRLGFYLNAKAGRTDYDVIDFDSEVKNNQVANATLNLLNWDLKMRGIERVQLSDSQNVFVYPKDQEITMQKDRFFKFAGKINAGRFELFGKEFSFDYINFKLNLTNTDSLRIKVRSREKDDRGEYPLIRCRTIVEGINGDLLIDKPYNKSGVKNYSEYPIFNSYKPSFAYYDKKNIQGGIYKRDKFYFQLDPFTIDSIDNFTNEALHFDGTFVSAGIFPNFKEKITLQEDYSLGFIRPTPPEGFQVYAGKGTFEKDINLSNKGLRGDGVLKYLISTSSSKEFFFYPDSVNAIAQTHEVKEVGPPAKVEYPKVEGKDVYIHWLPKNDRLYTHSKKDPIKFYNGKAFFRGYSTLQPEGLSANGRMEFNDAALTSTLMKFKSKVFDSDTSAFELKNGDTQDMSLNTTNVKAHIDFEGRFGEFKSNGGGSRLNFPANKYICFMDQFKWFMDKKEIELSASKDLHKGQVADPSSDIDIDGPEFVSTHPDQDSLRFKALRAKYDIKKNIIYCKEVKLVNVADVKVFPDSGNLVIQRNAKIDELKKAKILANSITKYHNIYNARVNILGRKSYTGSGEIDYVDDLKKQWHLKFDKLAVDTTFQTYGEGTIADSMKFQLSPQFDFMGTFKLRAVNQFLTFDGSTRLAHSCDAIKKSWLKFEAPINPKDVLIPISTESTDRDNNKLTSGLAYTSSDSARIYSAFLSKKENYSDADVITAGGFLTFDKATQEYRISTKEKLKEINFPGNYISLNTKNCTIYGEGKIGLAGDLGQVKLASVGNGSNNLINNETSVDVIMSLDFFFDEGAIKKIAEALEMKTDASGVSYSRSTYERGLRELIGKEEADKLLSQLNLYGTFKKFPSELEHTFLFTELKMKWNPETRSFVSDGKIGLGSIFKNQVNKKIEGTVEIVKKRGGDVLNIYFKLDESNWYFFNYQNGLMQAIAADEKFNTIIKELKPEKRKMETEKGAKPYSFSLSTEKKKKDFLKKFIKSTEE